MAHHMNRTMSVMTDYEILDQQFLNSGRLDLATDIWFAYDMNLLNKTYVSKKGFRPKKKVFVSFRYRHFYKKSIGHSILNLLVLVR